MPYRVELAKTNRAGCTDTVCKKEGIKIDKGELRLGTWVEMPDTDKGSWKWKHWGCVSGLVVQGLRESLGQGGDNYDWDALDGYDELEDHPDVQEKIRRVVTDGHIAPEDFKGDPEYNKLGSRGIRAPAPRGKKAAQADNDEDEAKTSTPAKATKAKAASKRGRKAAEDKDDSGTEEEPAAKKSKKTAKAKKVDEAADPEPTKKEPTKKATKSKKNGASTDPEPTKKTAKSKKVAEDEESTAAPVKKRAARKAKAVDTAAIKDDSASEDAPALPNQKKKRGKKA